MAKLPSRSATRWTVSILGCLVGYAGFEHGIGEILQGNVAPSGVMIRSWPHSEAFRILDGEPAMTLIPNLLVSGWLTIVVSVGLTIWVVGFVHRRFGALIFLGLCIVLLLVGGGFGPPLMGVILGAAATRIHRQSAWGQRIPEVVRAGFSRIWSISIAACICGYLALFPGMVLLSHFTSLASPALVGMLALFSFAMLGIAILGGLARDSLPRV